MAEIDNLNEIIVQYKLQDHNINDHYNQKFLSDNKIRELESDLRKCREEKQKYEIRQTLIGPNKAWEYGKGAPGIAEYKWIETVTEKEGVKESAGTWRLLEPRPTFFRRKDELDVNGGFFRMYCYSAYCIS